MNCKSYVEKRSLILTEKSREIHQTGCKIIDYNNNQLFEEKSIKINYQEVILLNDESRIWV